MWTDATRAQYARADLAFGREVRAAQAQRRKRLVSEQLAEERDGRTVYRRNMLAALQRRSEEHTSELQSLMRISYAVFCLKKKTDRKEPKEQSDICVVTRDKREQERR